MIGRGSSDLSGPTSASNREAILSSAHRTATTCAFAEREAGEDDISMDLMQLHREVEASEIGLGGGLVCEAFSGSEFRQGSMTTRTCKRLRLCGGEIRRRPMEADKNARCQTQVVGRSEDIYKTKGIVL